jgi:hypothetical protein
MLNNGALNYEINVRVLSHEVICDNGGIEPQKRESS